MKKMEMKIGLILDNYKLPEKEKYWREALSKAPYIEQSYIFDREETVSISPTVTSLIRYYKLKRADA